MSLVVAVVVLPSPRATNSLVPTRLPRKSKLDFVTLESGSVIATASESRSKVEVVVGPPAAPVLVFGKLELTWLPKASQVYVVTLFDGSVWLRRLPSMS